MRLEIDKPRDVVLLREPFHNVLSVLAHAALEKISYSGVENPGSVGHDVDVVDGH